MALSPAQYDLLVDCISFLDTDKDKLTPFEIDFLTGKGPSDQYDSLVEKEEKYGEDIKLSDKQIAVLQRMYDKVVHGIEPSRR